MLRTLGLRCATTAAYARWTGHRAYSQGKRVHVILNHRVRGLKPSATLRVNELSNDMIENGRCAQSTQGGRPGRACGLGDRRGWSL